MSAEWVKKYNCITLMIDEVCILLVLTKEHSASFYKLFVVLTNDDYSFTKFREINILKNLLSVRPVKKC